MIKDEDEEHLNKFDLNLLVGIWYAKIKKKKFTTLVGAKEYWADLSANKNEINNCYRGKMSKFWSAKQNTVKHRLKRMAKYGLIFHKGEGVNSNWILNKKRADFRVSNWIDLKEDRDYLCIFSKKGIATAYQMNGNKIQISELKFYFS